jgi:peptidyl-prolyl cis-trans isomerase D
MFEYIRTHKRIMQGLLLLFIFPSFALFGVDSFLSSRSADNAVAKVGKESISRQEFDQAQRNQLDSLKQAYGPNFDAQMLNTPEAKQSILDNLIARKAIAYEAIVSKLTMSDDAIQKNILETPGLKKPDGSFDLDRYKSLLSVQGMSPVMYEQSLRQDLVIQQLVNSVQNSAFNSKFLADKISTITEQEREVQSISFNVAQYVPQVKVTDAMLRAYYDKNATQFTIPEQVNIEYVVLNDEAVSAQAQVTDAEIAAFYEQNKNNYTSEEQRRASHILLNLTKDNSASETKTIRAKAESLLAQVKKNPELFAQLAKENSQDLGTSENGGDLDYFGRGAMVKAFDEAVFKLKENEISGLVQSEYGIHIIQLTAIKPKSIKSLDEVKAQLSAEIKKQKATKAFSNAAEEFTSLAYDQPESLQPLVDKLKLKVEKVNGLSRVSDPALPTTLASNNPKFLKAIFLEDSLKKKLNTEATEVAPNTLVVGRVVDYKPASKRSFDEVKPVIVANVTQIEAQSLAKKAGEAKLKTLKAQDSSEGFSETLSVSRLKQPAMSKEEFLALMKADVQKLPSFVGVDVPGQGYKVYRIAKVTAGTPDAARRLAEAKQIDSAVAQQDLYSYVEALKAKAKVVINTAALNSNAPSGDTQ